ncbi:MmgE/PrpD family protein [Actinocorallia sp. A-T 12471]|uniref:MmgE/PrpD family protein n=1 Tax=Actinocorallia sp. A-T 12471 TaxID=3089813 RepID=UPI0029CD8397|nr:MmgE/PrpD family protein [Actinocorallia sp. A-T 12471]MDX6744345.1 MmgE/PrpD family protein [Actinocorallia sp. A-T 12471]
MISRAFAEWTPEPPPKAVTRLLVDGLGCAVAAARAGEGQPALTVARALGGPPEATVLPGPTRVSAPAAAFANGVLVHALGRDPVHGEALVHPAAVVLPVAFAVGEEVSASGAEIVAAAGAGMELMCRLALAVPRGFHRRGLHATPVCGVFGAALTAARLYALDADTTRHALGIAGSQAGGLLECVRGGTVEQAHAGFAAQSGIVAARLAEAGLTGPRDVLDGDFGLYRSLLGEVPDPSQVVAGLGEVWEIERVAVKPYAACRMVHAALDAAALVRRGLRRVPIEEVEVELHPDALPFVTGRPPRTPHEARFDLAWNVAAILVDGKADPTRDADVRRPDIRALAARVTAKPGPGDHARPAGEQPARVTLRLADGTRHEGFVPRPSGGPDDPGLDALIRAKASLGRAAALLETLHTLPSLTPILRTLEDLP